MAGNTKYVFNDMRDSFHNFFRPSCKVTADGIDLTEKLQCKIHSVTAKLCMSQPSEAEVELVDCYDMERHSIKSGMISGLLPGTKLQISLGYGSQLSLLFSGFIEGIEAELSDDAAYVLRIKGADVRRLMQENGMHRRVIQAKKHSEAFKEIMKGYQGFCEVKADETSEKLTQGLFQTESDYEFVTERLIRETGWGFEFLVEKGIAIFRKCDASKKPVTALSPGQGIKKLQIGRTYVNQEVKILGYSEEQGLLSAIKKVKAEKINGKAAAGKSVLSMPWLTTKTAVKAAADSYGNYLLGKSRYGTLITVGLPVLMPGNYLSIVNADSVLDGVYYISEAVHSLGEDGYTTTIQL